jgi:hypothetical protein
MSKIFRQSETKEIEYYLSTNDKVSPELKRILQEDLHDKANKYKDSFIWLISRNEAMTIDVFNVKGEVFETDTFYFKDYPNS